MTKGRGVVNEVLNALLNLELALEADAWVLTLSSNWCRLIDALRMTVAGKTDGIVMDLSAGEAKCGPLPEAAYCYLTPRGGTRDKLAQQKAKSKQKR